MHNRRNYNIIAMLAAILVQALASSPTEAQDSTIRTKSQAEILIPRPAKEPVKSMELKTSAAMDTIATADPFIKILLFSDYTWKYIKDPSYVQDQSLFTENWDHEFPNPFNVSESDLPSEIGLWIVDSLSGYRCPNQVPVYSKFGYRHGRRHQGVDLPLQTGTPVYAAFDGKVRVAKRYKAYGNLVIIRHENGLETFYGHLSKIMVQEDEWVSAGSIIGLGGSTGRSTGPHLHFETRYKGYAFDPEWLIDFETGTLRHRLFVLKKKYLNAGSKYVPESEQEEIDIEEGDTKDREEAAKKAEEERKAAAAIQYHTIRQGDTLGKLAIKYHTSIKTLCRLNGIKETTILQLGKKLRVR